MTIQGMTPFLEACEALGPLQFGITLPQGEESQTQVWHRPFVILGRDPQADIVIADPNVSRRHAYVQIIAGRAFCMDLGSRTGLNWGSEINTQAWLDPDKVLRLGDSKIRLATACHTDHDGVKLESPLHSRPDESLELPYVTLEFINGSTKQVNWPMYSILAVIGRSPACRVRLESPSVSRYHCSLVRTPFGLWVVDLQGREGVRVNGQRIRYVKLEDNDDLQMGRFKIRIHCGPSPRSWRETEEGTAVQQVTPTRPLIVRQAPMTAPAIGGPSPRGPVLTPAAVEAVQSIVAPLMNEFASMQQNLFDQFQQSMTMMVQRFRAVNQEQMKEVRQELQQIKDLTQEMKELQAELIAAKSSTSVKPEAETAVAFSPLPTKEDQQLDLLLSALTMSEPSQPAAMPIFEPILPEPKMNPVVPLSSEITAPPEPPVPMSKTLPPNETPVPANGASSQADHPAKPSAPAPLPKVAFIPTTGADLHGWLTERLATIQHERQTRMQKILSMLTGKKPGGGDMP
jgi:pSer/pThr/pTyr-binding forkhead associated (FHA) protein